MSNFEQTDQNSEPKSVKNKPFLEFFLTISWQESCLDLSCLVNFEKLKFLTCLEPKFLINWKSWIVLTAIWLSWSCLVLSFKILSLSWIVLSWVTPVLTHPRVGWKNLINYIVWLRIILSEYNDGKLLFRKELGLLCMSWLNSPLFH